MHRAHRRRIEGTLSLPPPAHAPVDPARPFVCHLQRGSELCRAPFRTEHALTTHQGIVHTADERGSPFRCPVPGCLFGSNTERNCERHVQAVHGGFSPPVICLPGEALVMSAVEEGQHFVGDTIVIQARVQRRTKNVDRLTLVGQYDEYATVVLMLQRRGCNGGSCGMGALQLFVGSTFVMEAQVSRRTKNVGRLTLLSTFDEEATTATQNAYVAAFRVLRAQEPENSFFDHNKVVMRTRPGEGCKMGSCGLAAFAAFLSLARGVPLPEKAMSGAIDGVG
ncbi:hypothetical protein niasHT_006205 [Heterodera trifolii]|uniref:C2H2-type domain-containing protein n=1 Tax=Heterodera trifolii TaxID=157864 RepID=A0ABD2MEM7_9BILA